PEPSDGGGLSGEPPGLEPSAVGDPPSGESLLSDGGTLVATCGASPPSSLRPSITFEAPPPLSSEPAVGDPPPSFDPVAGESPPPSSEESTAEGPPLFDPLAGEPPLSFEALDGGPPPFDAALL